MREPRMGPTLGRGGTCVSWRAVDPAPVASIGELNSRPAGSGVSRGQGRPAGSRAPPTRRALRCTGAPPRRRMPVGDVGLHVVERTADRPCQALRLPPQKAVISRTRYAQPPPRPYRANRSGPSQQQTRKPALLVSERRLAESLVRG